MNDEASYICNSCGEEIVVTVDLSAGRRQRYVEDCPVCCNPTVVVVEVGIDANISTYSEAEQDKS